MMTASSTARLCVAAALVASLAPLPVAGQAQAALTGDAPEDLWSRLFSFGATFGAVDYIVLTLALIAALVAFFLYYRANLLDGLKKMHRPAKVKLRSAGLALAVFAVVLLLAPGVPGGLVLVLAAIGLLVAAFAGLGIAAAAILVLLCVAFFVLWLTGSLSGLLS